MAAKCADRQLVCHSSSHASVVALDCMEAEIVETTFVISRFSDILKETTSFLVVPPKKTTRNDACLVSDLKNTPGLFGVVVVLLVLEG